MLERSPPACSLPSTSSPASASAPIAADGRRGRGWLSVVVVGARSTRGGPISAAPVIALGRAGGRGAASPHVPAPDDLAHRLHDVGHDRASRSWPCTIRPASSRHALDDAAAFDVRPGDRLLLDLPLCGTFGFSSLLAAVGGRATTLLDERFDPRRLGHGDRRARAITHYNASDDMVLRVLDTGLVRAGEHVWREGALGQLHQRGAHRRRAGGASSASA